MTNPYDQIYPQDELARIKMRNRRFQNTCAQEVMNPMMGGGNDKNKITKTGCR